MTSTNKLTKGYAVLTAAERFPLLSSAMVRGDDVEFNRLMSAAPRLSYSVPDHFGFAAAFFAVADLHRMEELSLAGMYLQLMALSDCRDKKKATQHFDDALFFGYLYKLHRDGWRRFCEGLSLDPDTVAQVRPGDDLLRMADNLAQKAAFTEEGALVYVRTHRNADAEGVPDADDIAALLGKAFEVCMQRWVGDGG